MEKILEELKEKGFHPILKSEKGSNTFFTLLDHPSFEDYKSRNINFRLYIVHRPKQRVHFQVALYFGDERFYPLEESLSKESLEDLRQQEGLMFALLKPLSYLDNNIKYLEKKLRKKVDKDLVYNFTCDYLISVTSKDLFKNYRFDHGDLVNLLSLKSYPEYFSDFIDTFYKFNSESVTRVYLHNKKTGNLEKISFQSATLGHRGFSKLSEALNKLFKEI